MPVSGETSTRDVIKGTGVLEKTLSINVSTGILGNRSRTSKGMDSVRKSINRIRVVERLSTKDLEKKSIASQRGTIVDVLIRLDDPDKLLNRVVKVELDLVRRRTDRLVTSELELRNEVLVRVLCHPAALVSIKENVINIERGSN
jgi:hypothetical protein